MFDAFLAKSGCILFILFTDCDGVRIESDFVSAHKESSNVTIQCISTCNYQPSVTLYKFEKGQPTPVQTQEAIRMSAVVTLTRDDNGVRFYCQLNNWTQLASEDKSFNVTCKLKNTMNNACFVKFRHVLAILLKYKGLNRHCM